MRCTGTMACYFLQKYVVGPFAIVSRRYQCTGWASLNVDTNDKNKNIASAEICFLFFFFFVPTRYMISYDASKLIVRYMISYDASKLIVSIEPSLGAVFAVLGAVVSGRMRSRAL